MNKRPRLTVAGGGGGGDSAPTGYDGDKVLQRKSVVVAPRKGPGRSGGGGGAEASSVIVFITPERIKKVFEPTEEMSDAEKVRETRRIVVSLSTLVRSQKDQLNSTMFGNILKTLKNHVDAINDDNWNIVQQSIQYGVSPKICGTCFTSLEELINEVLVHRPSYVNSMLQVLLAKLVRVSGSPVSLGSCMINDDGPSIAELKCFDVAIKLICRIIEVAGMKRLNRSLITMMSNSYPYVLKPPLTHYFYLRNLVALNKSIGNSITYYVLSVVFHKLTNIDARLQRHILSSDPLQEIVLPKREKLGKTSTDSFLIDPEEADEVIVEIIKSYAKVVEEVDQTPEICTLDISLSYLISYLSNYHENINFNSLLSIFEAEILPTFKTTSVQFAFFHLINLKEEYLNAFLDFLWKKFLNLNTSMVLRIQAVGYIAGVLARSTKVDQRTLKRWISRLCNYSQEYLNSKSSSSNSHWSSVNVHTHGPFYAACQAIFYTFVFRHFELAYGNVLAALTKEGKEDKPNFQALPPPHTNSFIYSLNLQRLITSDLNPLKACAPEIAKTFVSVAHVYQISYCKTVLERNSKAKIRNVVFETMREASNVGDKAGINLLSDSFFPFDPLPLAYAKMIVDDHYRVYDPDSIAVKLVGESSQSSVNSSTSGGAKTEDEEDNCDQFDFGEDDTDSRDMLLGCE